MNKPRVFIASPLFNGPQHAIIDSIEKLLGLYGFDYYSARQHSGSDKLSAEDKKDLRKWDPVFQSNLDGLDECRVMIAVLEYALPEDKRMYLCTGEEDGPGFNVLSSQEMELPDAGTVWEMGYFRAQGKIVIGYHTDKAKHLNLMLSHGCDALIKGFENLDNFISGEATKYPASLVHRLSKAKTGVEFLTNDASHFDWRYTEEFDSANKVVE
jgi:nucleoside 2-deoxyribosyltransferase